MSKREDFLSIVQTNIILFFLNEIQSKKTGFNTWGLASYYGYFGDAIRASYRIPEDLTCVEAAGEFMQYYFYQNMNGQDKMECPSWFANLSDEDL